MLRVERDGNKFVVAATPPHVHEPWESAEPLSATEVLAELSRRGCHSTDATDALDASGADWRSDHNANVRRGRA